MFKNILKSTTLCMSLWAMQAKAQQLGPFSPIIQGTPTTAAALIGHSVAISADGKTIVSGAVSDNTGVGAVFVHTFDGTSITQVAKLPTPSPDPNIPNGNKIRFGYSIDITNDGKTIIASAQQDRFINGSGQSLSHGSAYIYTFNGTSFVQVQRLRGFDANVNTLAAQYQGTSVAISNDGKTAVSGDFINDIVYVFTFNGTNYVQKQVLKGSLAVAAKFGETSDISDDGSTIVIGGTTSNANRGAAWVFTFNGTSYTEINRFDGTNANDLLGYSVALSGNGKSLAFSARGPSSAWYYTFDGTNFSQAQTFSNVRVINISKDGKSIVFNRSYDIAFGTLTGTTFGNYYNYWSDDNSGTGPIAIANNGRNAVVGNPLFSTNQGKLTYFLTKTPQTITGFPVLQSNYFVDKTPISFANCSATSGLTVSITSSNMNIISINGTNLVFTGAAGTTNIAVFQYGDNNFHAAQGFNYTITVSKYNETITGIPFANNSSFFVDDVVSLANFTTASGLPLGINIIDYTPVSMPTATIIGSNLLMYSTGNLTNDQYIITLQYSTTGSNLYKSVNQYIYAYVYKKSQVLDKTVLPSTYYVFTVNDAPLSVANVTVNSGLPVTITSSNLNVVSVNGTDLYFVGGGYTAIYITQLGNRIYKALEFSESYYGSFEVNKLSQTIDFQLNTVLGMGFPFALTATVSSGLPITFTSNNLNIASIVGSNIITRGVGVVTITATQMSNTHETVSATGVLTITKGNLTITANNFSKVYGTATPTFTGIINGLALGDNISVVYSTTTTSVVNIGTYDIIPQVQGSLANYDYIVMLGTLTISKANLTVTADNFSRIFGEANPTFTASIMGIKNNDEFNLSFSTIVSETSNVGEFQILVSASGANIANYQLTINNGQLTITSALSNVSITGIMSNGNLSTATSFTISGSGFVSGATVTVNGVAIAAPTFVDGNTIIITVPSGLVTSTSPVVLVQNPNQAASQASSIVVVDATLSTNLPFYPSTKFTISPNPLSNGELKIENGVGALQIYNSLGAIVYSSVITSENTTLNLNLIKGIYLVKVGNQVSKLVVE